MNTCATVRRILSSSSLPSSSTLRRAATLAATGQLSPSGRIRRRPRTVPDIVDTGLVLAAVGRANVGKSTLFNRLGRAGVYTPASRNGGLRAPFVPSVVDAFPGVTRDARTAQAAISDLGFTLIDTAGLENAPEATGDVRSSQLDEQVHCENRDPGKSPGRMSLLKAGALNPDALYRALYTGMAEATVRAVSEADAAMFIVDASVGITTIDEAIARWLRLVRGQGGDGILLVANKADMASAESGAIDALKLGFGEPVVVSAEHNMGMADLYQAVLALHKAKQSRALSAHPQNSPVSRILDSGSSEMRRDEIEAASSEKDDILGEEDGELLFDPDFVRDEPIKHLVVSIVGRPNVGKSSLLSRLVGAEQTLVGPAAGVTRDAVFKKWEPNGGPSSSSVEPVWLVDTAGIRPRSRVGESQVETQSVKASLRALRLAHVAVLVVDANDQLTSQDVKIAHVAIAEGRAIVLVVNKIDCIVGLDNLMQLRNQIAEQIRTSLHHIAGVEVVEMSALHWPNSAQARNLHSAIQRARQRWEKRVPTSALTRYVTRFNETTALGMKGPKRGRRGTTKFISQKKTRPPMFRLDGSSAVSDNYIRALTNGIREEFGFQGVPIRIKRPSRR